jgi:hypothetical protein
MVRIQLVVKEAFARVSEMEGAVVVAENSDSATLPYP